MEEWLKICKDQGQPEYKFQPQEVRELTGFTYQMRLKEIDDLLGDARLWLIETSGEKTLFRFLYYIQDKLMPEPEVEWWSPEKRDATGDLEDALLCRCH